MTVPESSIKSPAEPAVNTADSIEAEFHDHIRFILQREREEREQLDMAIREQVLARIQKQGKAIGEQMQTLQGQSETIEKHWKSVLVQIDTQITGTQGKVAQLADDIRKSTEPIREYQVHAQKLQGVLQSLTQSVEQNTREVAGVATRALLGGALGGAGAALLIFLFLHLMQK
ncbi:hypothetical protein [Acidithiobacillus ferriphilus]|jgi:chromosome segregation ATPase|uniref:hypothetical protein n=1 Tax=Acidithiobacillus ferriphilus TaxID=1689834 RepID=UPI002DBE7F90|nr:hypothetical protein [Acidithiobacillus ferriphilus]MEB8474442.1 hypothetical protein [Acidithiobacillus ferriphilus]